MASSDVPPKSLLPADDKQSAPRVVRSPVPAGKGYLDYKPYLRRDFFYSCGYCSITEAEATGYRMTIDHYEPRKAPPDLEHEYSNLYYSCEQCNLFKGDRMVPDAAREKGHRFYKPDEDYWDEHFALGDAYLKSKSSVGDFSITFMDLNRASLVRLRQLRARLAQCDRYVAEGVLGLQHFRIDQLPPHLKGRANTAVTHAAILVESLVDNIEALLVENAQSPLLDDDSEAEARAAERSSVAKKLGALYPGKWHARNPRSKLAQNKKKH